MIQEQKDIVALRDESRSLAETVESEGSGTEVRERLNTRLEEIRKLLCAPRIPPMMAVDIPVDVYPLILQMKEIARAKWENKQDPASVAALARSINEFLHACNTLTPQFYAELGKVVKPSAHINQKLRWFIDTFNKHICMSQGYYLQIGSLAEGIPFECSIGRLGTQWQEHASPIGESIWEGEVHWTDDADVPNAGTQWDNFALVSPEECHEKYLIVQERIHGKANALAGRLDELGISNSDLQRMHRRLIQLEEVEHGFDHSFIREYCKRKGIDFDNEAKFSSLISQRDTIIRKIWNRFQLKNDEIQRSMLGRASAEYSAKLGCCLHEMRRLIAEEKKDEAYAIFLMFAESLEHNRKPFEDPSYRVTLTQPEDPYIFSAMYYFNNTGLKDSSAQGLINACESGEMHPALKAFSLLSNAYSVVNTLEERKKLLQ